MSLASGSEGLGITGEPGLGCVFLAGQGPVLDTTSSAVVRLQGQRKEEELPTSGGVHSWLSLASAWDAVTDEFW